MTHRPSSAAQPPSLCDTVLVADARSDRASIVAGVVRACGAQPRQVRIELGTRQTHDVTVVVVAVEGPDSNEAIRAFQSHEKIIIAYADGLSGWRLGTQAQLLLAGATCLLDSARATFADQLRGHLTTHLEAERTRHHDRDRVLGLMHSVGIIGVSRTMLDLFRLVMRVSALTELPVLIEGQTGTGKELIARALHHLDAKRRGRPFVAVNCSAINTNVAESELFGHRRGAFTGAERDYKGLFRLADGGVLFLDEISELDAATQGKLLRVLQDHRVLGVGEDRDVAVNVRVIAATNRDLASMVEAQNFRADLFHRLNVIALHVPSLEERREDIEPLVEHFLQRYSDSIDAPHVRPSQEFIRAIHEVPFPGNVRQLENLIRQTLVAKRNALPLDLGDLPAELWQQLSDADAQPAPVAAGAPAPNDAREAAARVLSAHAWSLERALAYYEHWLVAAALERERGNQSRAAQLLGITPRSVYNKIRKYSLSRDRT